MWCGDEVMWWWCCVVVRCVWCGIVCVAVWRGLVWWGVGMRSVVSAIASADCLKLLISPHPHLAEFGTKTEPHTFRTLPNLSSRLSRPEKHLPHIPTPQGIPPAPPHILSPIPTPTLPSSSLIRPSSQPHPSPTPLLTPTSTPFLAPPSPLYASLLHLHHPSPIPPSLLTLLTCR